MKTRRALQIIVGILSLLVLLSLLVAAACVGVVLLFKTSELTAIYDTVRNGFEAIANFIGLTGLSFILPLLAYVLPAQLLLIAAILLFLPDRGKQGKYIAGNVLALIAIALLTIFTIMFATDLATNVESHTWYTSPLSWTSTDTIVRYAACGTLALFIIFIGSALGVKPKQTETVATEEEAVVTESQEVSSENAPYETVAPAEEQQTVSEENETQYVPTRTSVSEIMNGVYGTKEQASPAAMDKINKARMLYEMGALTQDEYIKLVNIYTKQ